MQEPLRRSVSSVEGCPLAWDQCLSDPSPIHVVVTAAGAVGASIAVHCPDIGRTVAAEATTSRTYLVLVLLIN